jgi:BirA family biotin operon repressor/biotin-[acetyl-CoA-carboxylase] ligase
MHPNSFQLADLRTRLRPFRLYFYTRLRSTNDHAAALRRTRKLYAPAVVLAASQIAGRGRGSNTWWSGRGSLTVTFCLPADNALPPHHVPLLAGWAVRDACIGLTQRTDIKVKWPNDVWHDDLKFAGLLCERIDGVDLIGLGLNVNVVTADIPRSLRRRVTGLEAIAGRKLAMNDVLAAVAERLGHWLLRRTADTFGGMLSGFDAAHALHGRVIRVTEPGNVTPLVGVVRGLDGEGRLLLDTGKAVARIVAGHVELA